MPVVTGAGTAQPGDSTAPSAGAKEAFAEPPRHTRSASSSHDGSCIVEVLRPASASQPEQAQPKLAEEHDPGAVAGHCAGLPVSIACKGRVQLTTTVINFIASFFYIAAAGMALHFWPPPLRTEPRLGFLWLILSRCGTGLYAIAFFLDIIWVAAVAEGVWGAVDVAGTVVSGLGFLGLTLGAVTPFVVLFTGAWLVLTGLLIKSIVHFHRLCSHGPVRAFGVPPTSQAVCRELTATTALLTVGGTLGAVLLAISVLPVPERDVPLWYGWGALLVGVAVLVWSGHILLTLSVWPHAPAPTTVRPHLDAPPSPTEPSLTAPASPTMELIRKPPADPVAPPSSLQAGSETGSSETVTVQAVDTTHQVDDAAASVSEAPDGSASEGDDGDDAASQLHETSIDTSSVGDTETSQAAPSSPAERPTLRTVDDAAEVGSVLPTPGHLPTPGTGEDAVQALVRAAASQAMHGTMDTLEAEDATGGFVAVGSFSKPRSRQQSEGS